MGARHKAGKRRRGRPPEAAVPYVAALLKDRHGLTYRKIADFLARGLGLTPSGDPKAWAYDLVRRGRLVHNALDAHFPETFEGVEALGLPAPAHPLLPRVGRVEPPGPGAVYRLAPGASRGPRVLEVSIPDTMLVSPTAQVWRTPDGLRRLRRT